MSGWQTSGSWMSSSQQQRAQAMVDALRQTPPQDRAALNTPSSNAPSQPAAPPAPPLNPNVVTVSENGKFLIHGRSYDLLGLIFMVQKAASQHAKERLALSVQDLQDANDKSKRATDWLNQLRAKRPADSDGTVKATDLIAIENNYVRKYGSNPWVDTGTRAMANKKATDTYTQSEVDQMIEGTKSYMSTINNDQQMIQLDTERYTHMVDETSESMASIEKAMANAIESVISKI